MNRSIRRLAATLAVALAAAAAVWGGPGAAAADEAVSAETPADPWAQLERLAAGAEPVATYAADFTQEKHTPLLREPIVSRGRVRIADGVSRWDTEAPYASTMHIADGTLRLHYPEQRTLEVYELGDRLDALAASPVPDLAVLRENFTIDRWAWDGGRTALTLGLRPRTDEIAEAIESVTVEIDPGLGVLRRLELTDLDGETTALRFENVRLNPGGLDEATLELVMPAGTEVVRPLEVVGG